MKVQNLNIYKSDLNKLYDHMNIFIAYLIFRGLQVSKFLSKHVSEAHRPNDCIHTNNDKKWKMKNVEGVVLFEHNTEAPSPNIYQVW